MTREDSPAVFFPPRKLRSGEEYRQVLYQADEDSFEAQRRAESFSWWPAVVEAKPARATRKWWVWIVDGKMAKKLAGATQP